MTIEVFPRPYGITESAILLLYQQARERQTGLTTTALTLENAPVAGMLDLYKNGVLLDPAGGAAGYTILNAAVTLGAAAIAGDVFVARYYFRGAR